MGPGLRAPRRPLAPDRIMVHLLVGRTARAHSAPRILGRAGCLGSHAISWAPGLVPRARPPIKHSTERARLPAPSGRVSCSARGGPELTTDAPCVATGRRQRSRRRALARPIHTLCLRQIHNPPQESGRLKEAGFASTSPRGTSWKRLRHRRMPYVRLPAGGSRRAPAPRASFRSCELKARCSCLLDGRRTTCYRPGTYTEDGGRQQVVTSSSPRSLQATELLLYWRVAAAPRGFARPVRFCGSYSPSLTARPPPRHPATELRVRALPCGRGF